MRIPINQIEWHDSEIEEIRLVSEQDSFDTLRIKLSSIVFVDDFGSSTITIEIKNCYKIRTEFNLWISGKDTVNAYEISNDSFWIEESKKSFKNGFGPDNSDLSSQAYVYESVIDSLAYSDNLVRYPFNERVRNYDALSDIVADVPSDWMLDLLEP